MQENFIECVPYDLQFYTYTLKLFT